MLEHLFMPMDRHLDDGFGAVADAFREVADRLVITKTEDTMPFGNGHLPINFLYRHAIELYLKSMIMVVHRRLKLPTGEGPHQPNPKVQVGRQWKEIYQVHGILDLFRFFKSLVQGQSTNLRAIAKNDWSDVPAELESWIETIDKADSGSTFFRYPMTKDSEGDAEKSSYKEVSREDVSARLQTGGMPGKVYLLVKDDDENIVASYGLDHDPLPEVRDALTKSAELLNAMQCGMYVEVARGL
jgi:hypothetical protein